MGIPKFFRWLTRRYPMILHNIRKEEDCPPTGILTDIVQPICVDNLYLDLNGIVHNCIHGNDSKRHERVSQLGDDLEEVWANIMKAIDEIVHTIKPRKVLFLAVDGVAPRAKMNQQRARRFRSAKDAMMLRQQLESQGKQAPELFDSNAISPGTQFMDDLSKQLDFFLQYKLNTDPLYQKLKVVLSDSSVPGEGEHKMMDYVRQAKLDPTYDPNTRHCFYGADADLIMLSLITHEPHFMILREEHIVKKTKQGGVQRLDLQRTQNFQLIHISLLREYLHLEYTEIAPKMKMRFDLERIIDDFVLFCFFIGNDFLPSLSALDISEGSLDQLIDFYKLCLPTMTDYITDAGKVYWDRAQPFIQLLGQHEHEVFKNRIHQIDRERVKIVSWDSEFNQAGNIKDKATMMKYRIQEKLLEKKKLKIQSLIMKNKAKEFKKHLLLKKFQEDDIQDALTPLQLKQREDMILKYKAIRDKQYGSEKESLEDQKQSETLTDIIYGIKEDYFSDLQPSEIPDEHVSDVNESEIDLASLPDVENNQELESKIAVQNQLTDKACEQNAEFMRDFVKKYAEDPDNAKASYYEQKLGFEVKSDTGHKKKVSMLKKYLEGLQWVLYYYYKGVQHWRWYYPYHYAPMISDIGDNIVQDILGGQVVIDEFELDYNCSEENRPYTPFQQLLSILPTKSIHLLPAEYRSLATGILEKYFPADFDIDLNGRTLPWEAICLIPFVDDKLFLGIEREIKQDGLDDGAKQRNQISFAYKCYLYDKKKFAGQQKKPLDSTLRQLSGLKNNYVTIAQHDEYKDVGKHSFSAKLHPNVIVPGPDYPSFKWLNVNSIEYDTKVINGVPMKRLLVKIPSCLEESSPEEFEKYIYKFISQAQKELYVNFPYLNEAFPTVFEDKDFVYQIYGDAYTGNYRVHKQPQNMTLEEFEGFQTRQRIRLCDKGISIGDAKTFVIVNKVSGVQYDSHQGVYYKIFDEEQDRIPFNLVVKRRDPDHYLNVNQRVSGYHFSLKPNKEVVCLNTHLFGVVGELSKVDVKKGQVKVHFDKEIEESKIHDPFIGQNVLMNRDSKDLQYQNTKRFYTDQQIEQDLRLSQGVVNRLTGSFLVSFIDRQSGERAVFDLGMNIKNYTKKVHIPDYVRYVAEDDSLADNQFDSYQHNFHARGAKHVRKHWEYSQDCYDIIREYYEKYQEVIHCIARTMRNNKQMNTLKDLFKGVDEQTATAKVKEIAQWIESLPISNLPYVEMGFDALATDVISKLDNYKNVVKNQFQPIQLNVREFELLQMHMVYQECFPFWSPPYSPKDVQDFRIGDRVMNLNSSKREYIPFGLRGTVIGKTNERIIILFDEQFLNGSNIYGHCRDYKGAQVSPAFLLNLTKKFINISKKNASLVQNFQEQPVGQVSRQYSGKQEEEKKYEEPRRTVQYQKEQEQKPQYQPKQQENKQDFLQGQQVKKEWQQQQPQVKVYQQKQPAQAPQQQPPQQQEPVAVIQEQQTQPVQQQQESGFNMLNQNTTLSQNADFQQLMSLMDLAQQMQKGFGIFNNPEVQSTESQEQPSNLNVNANEFVPQQKKTE